MQGIRYVDNLKYTHSSLFVTISFTISITTTSAKQQLAHRYPRVTAESSDGVDVYIMDFCLQSFHWDNVQHEIR